MSHQLIGKEQVSIRNWPAVLAILRKLKNPPRRMLLFGRKGSGKTTAAMALSERIEAMSVSEGQFADAIYGKYLLQQGSTLWVNAAPVRAAAAGVPLLIDELHEAGPELSSPLKAILNDPAVCRLNLDNGETVIPKAGYEVVATMNGSPDQLNEAVLDRFDVVLRCDMPADGIFKRLTPESAGALRNRALNEPPTAPEWVPDLGARQFLSFDHLRAEGVSDELAAEIVFGEGQGKTVLMSLIDAVRNAEGKV